MYELMVLVLKESFSKNPHLAGSPFVSIYFKDRSIDHTEITQEKKSGSS
jgi:hypothetical protein